MNTFHWLSYDQNMYILYYNAHISRSYIMNMEGFVEIAVHFGVLFEGRLMRVEQRVVVRALMHLATYLSTFFLYRKPQRLKTKNFL